MIRNGGDFQGTPAPTILPHLGANLVAQDGKIFVRRKETAPHHEHFPQILGQPFVDPEKPGPLRGMKIWRDHPGGLPVFPAPGMDKFVRKQIDRPFLTLLLIHQVLLSDDVKTGP